MFQLPVEFLTPLSTQPKKTAKLFLVGGEDERGSRGAHGSKSGCSGNRRFKGGRDPQLFDRRGGELEFAF